MITNVPSPAEFGIFGVEYLNLGWSMILDIIGQKNEAVASHFGDEPEDEDGNEMSDAYWAAAEREVATALTLILQGAEFLLKFKICSVSPFLLISKGANDWPKGCDKKNVSFSEFKTIDAQDLIKTINVFCDERLGAEFEELFTNLRQERNRIIHSISHTDKSVIATIEELIINVLIISEHLLGDNSWLHHRTVHIQNDRSSAYYWEESQKRVIKEFEYVFDLLNRKHLKRFFGIPIEGRLYLCPGCCKNSDWGEIRCKCALLIGEDKRTTLLCYLCKKSFSIKRQDCVHAKCKGDVYDIENEICCTCGLSHIEHEKFD